MSPKQKDKNQEPLNQVPKFNPVEIKIADALFVKFRKNMLLFKDLTGANFHYSLFSYGSTLDMHLTYEKTFGNMKKHVQIVKMQIDWPFLLDKVAEDLTTNLNSFWKKTRVDDPEFKDIDVEFISPEMLDSLLRNAAGQNRWNVDEDFFAQLEGSLEYLKLSEIAGKGAKLGWSSDGCFVISNGVECWILNTDRILRLLRKCLEQSIRKIELKYYTIGTITWWAKIRLLNLRRNSIEWLSR
jgi:hypothetical protein